MRLPPKFVFTSTEMLTVKVFIVIRNDKIDQVFFNVDPAIARTAAEARSRKAYYKIAGIPYYKGRGKFHDYVVRKSDVS